MSIQRTNLTEELLKDALLRRGDGPRSTAELVGDVLTAVGGTSQGRAWGLGTPSMARPIAILVAVALLLAAIAASVLFAGGQVLRGDPRPAAVIAQYAEIHVGWAYVFADGRVVFHLEHPIMTYERWLTQAGIDLVWSGVLPARAFLPPRPFTNDMGQQIPTRAWADDEARLYEPATYAICYFQDRQEDASKALERLPTPAQALLRGRERVFQQGMVEVVGWLTAPAHPVGESRECWEVTADEARVLFGILAAAGWNGDPNAQESLFEEPSPGDGPFDLVIDPKMVLPHGVIQAWGG